MDLHDIDEVLRPSTRADLPPLAATDGLLSGGTWLFSQPQPRLRRLVDLTAQGWPDLTIGEAGIDIAATCTIDRLVHAPYPQEWISAGLVAECARALLMSFKIWPAATIGGNLCLGLPAGAMISLCTAMDARMLIWSPDGTDRWIAARDFVADIGATALEPGEILRQIVIPAEAFSQRTAFRKLAYAELGRSGVVVIGRRTDSDLIVSITASTRRPYILSMPLDIGSAAAEFVSSAVPDSAYHADAHGTVAWRKSATALLAAQVATELVS